ncbi:slipin family protein [Candidatus Woesearchaeota archaeon]|nr:slipin family protein [Candidatus Woesearchaeota archaeon]
MASDLFFISAILASVYLSSVIIAIAVFSFIFLRIFYEYEKVVLFTLGRYSGTIKPGLRFIVPIIQTYTRVDIRMEVVDVPQQNAITKDNVSVNVNAVLYFRIFDAKLAVIKVENYLDAVSQLAQTTMRNVVGEVTLDELLSQRDKISNKIREIVDKATDPWGVKVISVDLKHIELAEEMKRVMAKAAEAERLRRAIIIRSDGDAIASTKIAQAAKILSTAKGALHLRTLQSLNDIASDPSNKVNFIVPLDTLKAYDGYKGDE